MFDLSHDIKLSLNMGELVPIMCMEAIPGDRVNIGAESLLRFQPLVAPVMHNMAVTMHYWFVPNRILWEDWEKFITNTKSGGVLPSFPTWTVNPVDGSYNRLLDYLGIPDPAGMSGTETISALPMAAYQLIYNEFYRDQNLQPDLVEGGDIVLQNGSNNTKTELGVLRNRAWEHDYFTSALPFAQKGDPVLIPLSGFDDVIVATNTSPSLDPIEEFDATRQPSGLTHTNQIDRQLSTNPLMPNDALYAKTSDLQPTSTNINDLRRAFKIQEWLEAAARGGTRLKEYIWSMFGVDTGDSRLQRPEYITGTKSPVIISEVLNTTGTVDAPQGNMAGHGISVTNGHAGSYFCREHGYIIGIMSVMPKTAYQQGIERHWLKTEDPTQYFFKQFANIGEQEIINKELYAFDSFTSNDVFGYTPRYAEYKYMNNRVAGDMRNNLDFWHLGRKFAAPPVLNGDFIKSDPTHRVFAVTDPTQQKVIAHVYNKVKALRGMPKYGTPTF